MFQEEFLCILPRNSLQKTENPLASHRAWQESEVKGQILVTTPAWVHSLSLLPNSGGTSQQLSPFLHLPILYWRRVYGGSESSQRSTCRDQDMGRTCCARPSPLATARRESQRTGKNQPTRTLLSETQGSQTSGMFFAVVTTLGFPKNLVKVFLNLLVEIKKSFC